MIRHLTLPFFTALLLAAACVPYYQQGQSIPGDENAPPDFIAEGRASFMADEMQGMRTASGRIFNLRERVAAHPTLPFGTIVEVTNLRNNKKVEVEVIDRGPFVRGRIIDVSFQAAKELGFVESGTTEVRLRIVRMGTGKTN
ncbi:MAG: septal ring lytic transglycosylase RlpA family protein [candidate division KSB1 bacterium]|nr:septal ring lytic transglycosylase RlpA family protein [candidate division KSB1 bacterium]